MGITGSSGFIGRHLVAALGSRAHTPLRLLSRRDFEPGAVPPSATAVRGDLLDPDTVRGFVSPGAVVVNLAFAQGAPAEVNRAMADNLATACLRAPAGHLIHCSTAVVAGRPDADTVVETVACRPVTAYQASKLEIEQLLRERLDGRCPLTILRPTAVFGNGGANLRALIEQLLRRPWLLNLASATLFADRRLHLVSVDNVVAAFLFALSTGAALDGEVFIVSDDEAAENNYRDVLNILARELGVRPFPRWRLPFGETIAEGALRLARRPDPNPRRIYSSRKLRERGFRPPLELIDGVREFARGYVAGSGGG